MVLLLLAVPVVLLLFVEFLRVESARNRCVYKNLDQIHQSQIHPNLLNSSQQLA